MHRILWLCVLFLCVATVPAQEKHPITFDDLIAMGRLSDPQVSPDGKTVAFVVTNYSKEENSSNSNIYLVPTDGGGVRQLTSAPKQNNNPRWSRDGRTIFFVSSRDGESQVWSIPVNGGDARKLTTLSTEVSGLTLSPDGSRFVAASDVFPDCPTDEANKARLDSLANSKVKARILTHLPYRVWNAWKDGKRSHVFAFDIDGKNARDLTPGDYDTPPIDLGGSQDYDISPDGQQLVFTRNTDPMVAISTNNDLFLTPITGGPITRITENKANDSQPVFSPDGKYIAYQKMERPGFEADRRQLVLYECAGGKHISLTPTFDYSVGEVLWSPDSKTLYFTADDEGNVSIFKIAVSGGEPVKLLKDGRCRSLTVTPDGRTLIFLREKVNLPSEIFRMDTNGKNLRQLTSVNSERVARLEMNSLESYWFAGAGGTKVEGFLLKPPGFRSGMKYPMIFLVHGGPQGQWEDEFHYRWNAEMFASRGYVVVMINPRGSTGYGQKFTDEISGDWGGKVYEDLMKGLDAALDKFDFIDRNRLAAAGASYGGYMMDWMEGHTNRFRCIVSHDGVFNPLSMYGTTEELWFPEWEFRGTPYQHPELFEKWSPFRSASHFKTPMLVIHGQLDYRVDVSEGFQLFTALQRQGVESKMLYFPDEGHFVLKPQNAELWWKTVLDWIDQHTK